MSQAEKEEKIRLRLIQDELPEDLKWLSYTENSLVAGFFKAIFGFSLKNMLLLSIFNSEEIEEMLNKKERYDYSKGVTDKGFIEKQLINEKIKEDPIKEIESKLEFSEKYQFLLIKNQFNTLKALGIKNDNVTKMEEYIKKTEEKNLHKLDWIPYIASNIGDYPKNEIEQIFDGLNFNSKMDLIKKIDTKDITDENLKNAIESIKNSKNEEEFQTNLQNLQNLKFKDTNGANILLGLCEAREIEKLTKEKFLNALQTQGEGHEQDKQTILATALNPYVKTFFIHPPRGVLGTNFEKNFFNKTTPLNVENFKNFKSKPGFSSNVWNLSGNTVTEKGEITINFANKKDAIDTFLHEATHANMNALNSSEFLNFFAGDVKDLEKKLLSKIEKNLKSSFPKISNGSLFSNKVNIKELLKAIGIDEKEPEFKEMCDKLNEVLNDPKNPISKIENPFLRLMLVINNEAFKKYDITGKVKSEISQFLDKEDLANKELKNRDTINAFNDIYVTPTVNQTYASKNDHQRLDENVARINEGMKMVDKIFPKDKIIQKITENFKKIPDYIALKYGPLNTASHKSHRCDCHNLHDTQTSKESKNQNHQIIDKQPQNRVHNHDKKQQNQEVLSY